MFLFVRFIVNSKLVKYDSLDIYLCISKTTLKSFDKEKRGKKMIKKIIDELSKKLENMRSKEEKKYTIIQRHMHILLSDSFET